ncbi:MAG TPA: GWxTD domain-containing protein [Thermoanaerobaculia bacterium]|nr:GWxTD domain-containing protein [Thermoanaerobaculia bacterium]
MKRIWMGLIITTTLAGVAVADLSSRYTEWGQGPVQHLMTKEEMAQWKDIQTDAEAQAFADLFWARRDPTPQTERNEFRDEFDKRVVLADHQFTTPRIRGAVSDRGKVVILLGSPWQVGSRGAAGRSAGMTGNPTSTPDGGIAVQSARAEPARQTWTYGYDRKPQFIKQKEVTFVFTEEGRDDWQLALTGRANPAAILRDAVNSYIVSPGLTKAPVFAAATLTQQSLTSFTNSDLKSAYEAARSTQSLPSGPAYLTWGEFVSPDAERFVSFQLYVPGSAGIDSSRKLTLFGAVENASGQIVRVLEEPATLDAVGSDWYIDKSLTLEPGDYTAIFGLASEDGKPVAVTRTKMTVQGLDPAATGVSPLLLSSSIQPGEVAWGDTEPFTFGGLKVVPKGDAQFGTTGDLWYFVEMRNPGVTAEGAPNVQVKIDIEGKTAERKVRMNFPMGPAEITKLKGAENRYAVGMAIPLESFKPGDYTMKIRVVDSILGKNYDFERQFKVRG